MVVVDKLPLGFDQQMAVLTLFIEPGNPRLCLIQTGLPDFPLFCIKIGLQIIDELFEVKEYVERSIGITAVTL